MQDSIFNEFLEDTFWKIFCIYLLICTFVSIYNNRIVNLASDVAYVGSRTGPGAGGGRGRTTGADRLRAGLGARAAAGKLKS